MTAEPRGTTGGAKVTPKHLRPTWIAPGLVMCESCFRTENFAWADEHWLWEEPDNWLCPDCEREPNVTPPGETR
jgi:hypothetical protein